MSYSTWPRTALILELLAWERYQEHVAESAARPSVELETLVARKLGVARELLMRELATPLHQQPIFSTPQELRSWLTFNFHGREHEVFLVMFLDTHHRLIEAIEMFRGTLSQTSVYPREVVKEALRLNAGAVAFAHNHPSGRPEPSRADEALTSTLKGALALVDVRVIDHFVVGREQIVSFAERGLI